MAETGHSVCVRGLPSDMEHERLHDKLMIHFLRERHGGGEISSISIKAKDPYAIITFEDSRDALSACSHTPHVLEVDGKTYELSLSFPWQESQHLNKVILDMTVTIDCNHLPLGEKTIKTLSEKFSGLSVTYIKPQRHCTLKGPYSEVKDFVSHLVELLVDFKHPSECMSLARKFDGVYLYRKAKDISPDQSPGVPFGGNVSLHQESRRLSPKGNSVKLSQAPTSSDKKIKDWVDAVDVEAQSLIMEADVFAYLSSKSEDYKRILKNHKVHVVDVTSAGVTTLYLQSNVKVNTGSKAEKHLNHARKELSQLYQQVEGNLRRDQFPRSALYLYGEQTARFKDLESLLPKVLLSLDQTNVYIVGESSEVSQAKQILLFGSPDENLRAKQEILLSSSPSNSYSPVSESEIAGSSMESGTMPAKMRMSDAERRVRTGEEYKLAARFKNSDMGLLGFGSVERGKARERQDFSKGINTLTPASNSGPTLSKISFLGTPGTVTSDQDRTSQLSSIKVTGINNVKEDVLLQKMEPPSACTLKNRGQVSGNANRTNSLSCTSRLTPPGSTGEPTTTSTSSLKRTNSFSGQPLQKQETELTGINEKTGLGTNSFRRPRSSSVNSMVSPVTLPSSSISRTVTVPSVKWDYIKEACRSDLSTLIYELQMSESQKDKSNTVVTLQGSSSSKVEKCQGELQKLVDTIGLDFCIQILRLTDLGVTNGNDIFKECCTNIRSHFNKIVLRHVKDAILLMGPKSLCSQARENLKEMFPGGFSNSGPLFNASTRQGTVNQSQASASANQTPIKSNSQIRPNQTKADRETLAKVKLEGHQSDLRSAAYVQASKPVANELPKMASDLEISKTAQLSGKSSEVPGVLLGLKDDWEKLSSPSQKIQKGTTLTLKQTNLPINKQVESCVCGEIGAQTSCGVFLCSNCILLHGQCIVCSKVKAPSKELQVNPLKGDQNREELKEKEAGKGNKQEQGIQGTMKYNEMSLSLPGYEQYRTIKITYHIPDGIQEEEHPNPGLPFQGGVFEAYLPLNSKGHCLLQCLEKAFKQGFIFTVCPSNNKGGAKITWSRIPHKTNITGGKSGNGYPDSTYLKDLSEALRTCGIGGV